MLSARGSSVILLVITLIHVCCAIPFSWSDCGVQLNKALHYQSATISPQSATQGSPLSINVQATVADIVYNAETRVMVWKDGEMFLDVYIGNLCDIISNQKGLSCPLNVGRVSFTYEFTSVPALPSGNYVIDIRSLVLSAGATELEEIGCIEFVGRVGGINGSHCTYNSNFAVKLKGDPVYANSDPSALKQGDYLQIGPVGAIANPSAAGTFVGDFEGTSDVGGSQSLAAYTWTLNGTLQSHTPGPKQVDVYSGTFYIWNLGVYNMSGLFNLTFNYDLASSNNVQSVYGSMWFNPEYYLLDQFQWPVVLSNLGPFSVESQADGTLLVRGSQDYCTCGRDACGVCNGDGSTCDFGHRDNNNDDGWGARKIAAVICGIFAFLFIIVAVELGRRVRRARRRIPIDDTDLVDHPEKPDYGTMAIDDAIREGERVV